MLVYAAAVPLDGCPRWGLIQTIFISILLLSAAAMASCLIMCIVSTGNHIRKCP